MTKDILEKIRQSGCLSEEEYDEIKKNVKIPERPEKLPGVTRKVNTVCGNLYITINNDAEHIVEVFAQMGKVGGCASAQLQALSRIVSISLRAGVSPSDISRQLISIQCEGVTWHKGDKILSCADAIAKTINMSAAIIKNKQEHNKLDKTVNLESMQETETEE